jgi:hypothetical protein
LKERKRLLEKNEPLFAIRGGGSQVKENQISFL